jgi:2,3-bisphosphoglycerate-independent phosphoglycerate mutase
MNQMVNHKKICLAILDGWGKGASNKSNAVYMAKTPFANFLNQNYPHAELRTDGENVGLPEGQMGNSEVGHMNIGAGRVVYQDLVRINVDIREGKLQLNKALHDAFRYAAEQKRAVHLLGLVSDGGVHSHIDHLKVLVDLANDYRSVNTYIHAFMDGRDTDPKSGLGFIRDLQSHLDGKTSRIASVIGRYYAMDRDKRWERVAKAYDLFVRAKGMSCSTAEEAVVKAYASNITDEFIEPSWMQDANGSPLACIKPHDVVLCFNFRTDRCREITMALTQQSYPDFNMEKMPLYYMTMTNYDDTFREVHVVYDKDNLADTLGEVMENNGKTQVRIAETEKYPHVTFFFSGGREKEFSGERRIMIPSPKVATYDLKPEMSAQEIADAITLDMKTNHPDFICLNFANPDMVGHTGIFDAIVKAVETTDATLQQVVEAGLKEGYSFVIIADHGNADFALNEDGTPNTAHTTNPVPIWIIDADVKSVTNGKLADVAPTIIRMMGLQQPAAMTGVVLV